jgi:ribonucleoside-triphosphate reductase
MLVSKRDGSKEEFNPQKIENAILKAFKACDYSLAKYEANDISDFCKRLGQFDWKDGRSVEEIQDAVEQFLMSNDNWFHVGKAYMLYREQHKQARLISEKIKYIHKYTNSKDTATNLSNTDDNANSNQKNVASLESEVYKDINRIIQRNEMKHLLSEINSPYRDQYIKDLEHHIIYTHDEAS